MNTKKYADKLKRCNVTKAKRLYNEGKLIYLMASNMRLDNPWAQPCMIVKSNTTESDSIENTFESRVNSFSYYNCDKERGKNVHYYYNIEEEE